MQSLIDVSAYGSIYRRGDMLERRRAMAQAWADFLAGRATEAVVPMRGKV
ncbi:MAG: hypothetical protein O2910_00135 [Proteobacteria bacterium]|nr:hypothetical protein [Pseudomonadota bacterium]